MSSIGRAKIKVVSAFSKLVRVLLIVALAHGVAGSVDRAGGPDAGAGRRYRAPMSGADVTAAHRPRPVSGLRPSPAAHGVVPTLALEPAIAVSPLAAARPDVRGPFALVLPSAGRSPPRLSLRA
jgi:hypothetical protein